MKKMLNQKLKKQNKTKQRRRKRKKNISFPYQEE